MALDVKHCGNDQCISSGDALSPRRSAVFQDFALGMFSLSAAEEAECIYCTWPEPEISSSLRGLFKEFLLFSCLFCFQLFHGLAGL